MKDKEITAVLDVGAGSGRYAYEINSLGLQVTGIDVAKGMLDIAETINKSGIENGVVHFILSDYMEYHFEEKFDAAVLMGLFDYVQEPAKMIGKLKNDVSLIILASFPKSGGWLAWKRLVRCKIKSCPLYLYIEYDVHMSMNNAEITDYNILNFNREYHLVARP